MYKIAVITANLNNIDKVKEVPQQTVPFDYYYFNEDNLPTDLDISARLLSKYPKILTHKMLPDYDIYIWIDGSIEITSNRFVEKIISGLIDVKITLHPDRATLKEEFDFLINQLRLGNPYFQERYSFDNILKEKELFEDLDLPLYTCGVFARKNDGRVNTAFEEIWDLCLEYGNFDQPLYSYIEKKYDFNYRLINWGDGYKFNSHISDNTQSFNLNHISIIQSLIDSHKYQSYLEIGIETGVCFNSIKVKNKTGVDPDTNCVNNVKSGKFFALTSDDFFAQNQETFDIIFIDGLHRAEQFIKDVDNALLCLNPNGVIVCHDCNPSTETMQIVPREQIEWTGDVWKGWVYLRRQPDLSMKVMDCDYGCGIIQKGKQEPLIIDEPTYEDFAKNKIKWLNLISFENHKKSGVQKLENAVTSGTTMLLTTGYVSDNDQLGRYQRWIDYYLPRKEKLGVGYLFIVDDGSPVYWIEKLDVNIVNIQWYEDFITGEKGYKIPKTINPDKVNWLRFQANLGRPNIHLFPGWWRSYSFGTGILGDFFGFEKVIFIESDAFVLTDKCFEFIKNAKGYGSMWCPSSDYREINISWCDKNNYFKARKFFIINNSFQSEFWWAVNCNDFQYLPEFIIPFDGNGTNALEIIQQFKGDRYGDGNEDLPNDADFICNTHDSTLFKMLHPREEQKLQQLEFLLQKNIIKNDVSLIEERV